MLVFGSWPFVPRTWLTVLICSLVVHAAANNQEQTTKHQEQSTKNQQLAPGPFRPEAGKFPPIEKAHTYRGELVFVDHANRRGSLRVLGVGVFRRNDPHPFAMLPYGMVRYHGAPADLRDVPLGTILHVTAYLPPDPKFSAVPVLPVDNKERDANHARGIGIFPAENHVLLLEDEPSYCLRTGKTWKLKELEYQKNQILITASLEPKQANEKNSEEKLTLDSATRVWRGRECLNMADLIAEGAWPDNGKKSLDGQSVLLGLTWKPTPDGIFLQLHISDVWLDDAATQRAAHNQNEAHKTFMRSRWLPAWVDAVEYAKFGRAKVTVTLFGGMDSSLYADFRPGTQVLMNGAENTLKHTEAGTAGPSQMAVRGPVIEVTHKSDAPPLGSSDIQLQMETDLITEGIRPGRIVRIRPSSWPDVHVPREEYIDGSSSRLEERFPTPAIFPKY
jgi:hypothetical protein